MRHRPTYVLAVVTLALIAVGGFVTPAVATASTGTAATAQQEAGNGCDYADLYDRTIDSVVSVQRQGGQGSGFVFDAGTNESSTVTGNDTTDAVQNESTGYVVTNAHVVGDATDVTVQFRRGETLSGTVVGTDAYSDLAVIAVNETPDYVEGLSVAEEQPEHGERVAALGSPLGFDETITHGIVSGLNRSMPTQLGFTIPNVVQTDAPISPGNSGGPLVACDGTVVGVNTAGIAAQGAENIGFSVSATTVQRVAPSLIETGEYQHPTLGISAIPVTPAVAEANGLNVSQGVAVASVNEGAPAADVLEGSERLEQTGSEIVPVGGDVIVAVEGQPIANTEDLASVLEGETRPGDEVTLTVIRDGERTNVTTTVTERPDPGATATPQR